MPYSLWSQRVPISLPCPVWLWSNTSNIHVAKDRSWFNEDYTAIDSFISTVGGGKVQVIGIGSVNLPTKTSPNRTGPSSHGVLRLKNVLHVPSSICNIVGYPIEKDYIIEQPPRSTTKGSTKGSIISIHDKREVAYFDPKGRLVEIRLSGPPVGPRVSPSPFEASKVYYINARWPDSERKRHAEVLYSLQFEAKPSERLTITEKEWLKKNYDGEFKFLHSYGLNIYKDEDREEGRSILRALILGEVTEEEEKEKEEDQEPNSTDEFDSEAHPADDELTLDELEWIKANYGNLSNFFIAHRLKVYKKKDCEKAVRIARVMIAQSDEEVESESEDEFDIAAHLADSEFAPDELEWINKRYQNSRNFMYSYGLKFYKKDDCEEAAAIVRVLMAPSESSAPCPKLLLGLFLKIRADLCSGCVGVWPCVMASEAFVAR
ncbi:hypothetical protein BGZ63DRAFT_467867 [Mariannaea sp. PMI_226]|nr:hypothetical protein BGZ63DRAFT_467867 [Mariannaea sp. PMI_226]